MKIHTQTARARLEPRREPYWHRINVGRYIGFRRGPDTWIARSYRREHGNEYEALGTLRPESEAFTLALAAAEEWFTTLEDGAVAHYSIEQLISDYVEDCRLRNGDRSARNAELLLNRCVLPKFKGREVASITTAELKRWRNALVPHGVGAEAKRRSQDTANGLHSFRAALGLAFRDGQVSSDTAWRRIQQFAKVGKARDFYPTPEQVAALFEHCDAAMQPLARAGANTGFRLQALTAALVSDFDPKAGTLNIKGDKGHERVATLSSAAIELFKTQAKGKLPSAYLFTRDDGNPWKRNNQQKPFRSACNAAKLPKEFVFYSLRHYFISRALLAGMNVNALAVNTGTSAAMIAKHYGKFVSTDVRDMLDRVAVA